MTRDKVYAAVFRAAREINVNLPLTEATLIHADLGFDSLDIVEFQMAVEEHLPGAVDMVGAFDIGETDTLGTVAERILAGPTR